MLKNFHISGPNGRLDPHLTQGCWAGYVEIVPHTQELNETAVREDSGGSHPRAPWPSRCLPGARPSSCLGVSRIGEGAWAPRTGGVPCPHVDAACWQPCRVGGWPRSRPRVRSPRCATWRTTPAALLTSAAPRSSARLAATGALRRPAPRAPSGFTSPGAESATPARSHARGLASPAGAPGTPHSCPSC
jgi:hypothetical protein